MSTTAPEKTSESTESTTDDKNSPTSIEDEMEKASIPTPAPNQSLDENAVMTEKDMSMPLILPKYVRIMVPHDGSSNSDKALAHGIWLSKTCDAELVILHVLEDIEDAKVTSLDVSSKETDNKGSVAQTDSKDLKYTLEGQGIQIIEDKIRTCKENGVRQVSYKVQIGNPADEIIKLTQESNFDLIVMASRRITSRILGSTTRKVIDTVKKPTLIIPHMSSESEAF
ncbi:MAG: universal stress protein [Nitrososphaeraceae archaeon]